LIAVFGIIISAQSFSATYNTRLANDRDTLKSLFTHGISWNNQQETDTFTGADLLSNGTGQVLSMSLSGSNGSATGILYPDVSPSEDMTVSSSDV